MARVMSTSGGSFSLRILLPLEKTTGPEIITIGDLVQGPASSTGDTTVFHWKAKLRQKAEFDSRYVRSADSTKDYPWFTTTAGPKVTGSNATLFHPDYNNVSYGPTHTQWSTYGSASKVYCGMGRLTDEIYWYCQCNVSIHYNGRDSHDVSSIRERMKDSLSYYIFYREASGTNKWIWKYKSVRLTGSDCSWDIEDPSVVMNQIRLKANEAYQQIMLSLPIPPPWDRTYAGTTSGLYVSDTLDFRPPGIREFAEELLLPNPDLRGTFCSLAQAAVENIQYLDINSVAFIKELRDQLGEVQALVDLIRAPKNPKKWASFYLACQYGTKLTIADTLTIIKALQAAAKQKPLGKKRQFAKCRARDTVSLATPGVTNDNVLCNYKIVYRPYDKGLMALVDRLSTWDLLPSAGNLWDLVPYSFVVDWFVDIGGMLETCDAAMKASTLPVVGTTASFKRKYSYAGKSFAGVQWDIEYSVYSRTTSREVILPHPSLSFPGNAQNNILQLSAILVQKIK